MRHEEFREAVGGARPALEAACAKLTRATAAWLAAKATGDEARYDAAWAACDDAYGEYLAAARRYHALLAALLPAVERNEEAGDAAA